MSNAFTAWDTINEKYKWYIYVEWDDAYLNLRLLITTAVGTDWGNRLYELFDAICMVVNVSLVVTVQVYALPATVHEDAATKLDDATRLLDVIIISEDPAFVWNDAVTVNNMELSVVSIIDSLFG